MMALHALVTACRWVRTGILAAVVTIGLATTATAQEPKRGGTLTVGLAQDPPIVDPIRTGSFTSTQLMGAMGDGVLIADVIALFASFDIVAPELDHGLGPVIVVE